MLPHTSIHVPSIIGLMLVLSDKSLALSMNILYMQVHTYIKCALHKLSVLLWKELCTDQHT